MKQTELAEPHLAPPGGEQPAGGATAASSAQQLLDAIAQAVSLEPGPGFSAPAPVEVMHPEVAVMVRGRSKGRRSAAESEERAVLDSLSAASAELKLAVRNVRDQFLRLADVEIRKTLGVEAEARPARRGTRDTTPVEGPPARYAAASEAEAPDEAAAWARSASDPAELYEGTVPPDEAARGPHT